LAWCHEFYAAAQPADGTEAGAERADPAGLRFPDSEESKQGARSFMTA
jgi:hypothetical protein